MSKECKCCSQKSIFLKLTKGMCPQCSNEYLQLEKKFSDITTTMSNNNFDKKLITLDLNQLIVNLRKFKNCDVSLQESDCMRLLELLKSDNKLESLKIESEDLVSTVSSIDEIPNEENKKTLLFEPAEENQEEENQEDTIEATPKAINNPSINLQEIVDTVTKLVSKISVEPLDDNDLAYNILSLKDYYTKYLLNTNIKSLGGINIQDLIDNKLLYLSNKYNCDINEVFDVFNYVTVGIETSGQLLPSSEILELSSYKISYGKIIDTYKTYCKPFKSISKSAIAKTGISNDLVEDAPPIGTVLFNFYNFANGFKVITYNSSYIMNFIDHYLKLYNNLTIDNNKECLLNLYRTRYKGYHGEASKQHDITTICYDVLSNNDINEINAKKGHADTIAFASYKIFEILKYKYK